MKTVKNTSPANDLVVSTICMMIYGVYCEASNITDEQIQVIDLALKLKLKDKEYEVIKRQIGMEDGRRWGFDEIAKYFHTSRESICHIASQAADVIKRPDFIGILPSGLTNSNYGEKNLDDLTEQLDRLHRDPIFEKERELKSSIKQLMILRRPFKYVTEAKIHLLRRIPIESIDFSVSTYNSLKRAGINTLGEVIDLINHQDLSSIKNLSKKAQDAIVDKVNEFKRFVLTNNILY
ncbi:hypothetical protein IJJ36_01200 [Candidatus Saccharibacteria bacterium]|nr:hypothetical protein [Candidatus Saccharibacteria bacterium]